MQSSYGHTSPRGYWLRWAETLRRYHLDGFASWMLDGGQPLAILSAQALYFVRPFLNNDGADALAHTLESDEELRDFVSYLGGGADSWT